MGETFKSFCSLLIIFALCATAVSWNHDRPDLATWLWRTLSPVGGLLALAVLLRVHLRKDRATDYLLEASGNYFNRNGFCFAFATETVDGLCHLNTYFQNQYANPSIGRIALRPAVGFSLTRPKFDTIVVEIPCEGGAFGVATLPIPIPRHAQGRAFEFEVGASVKYPHGKGQRLRFHDGVFLRANARFGNAVVLGLTAAAALAGGVVLSRPATITIELPRDVEDELPKDVVPQVRTIWKVGDPPLEITGNSL